MLSGFFAKKDETPQTRFDTCIEFKQVRPLISSLRAKQVELKKAADKLGTGTLDNRKYLIVTEILAAIDEVITAFNHTPVPEDEDDNIKQLIAFIDEVNVRINQLSLRYSRTLNAHRNNYKEVADEALFAGTYMTTLAASCLAPVTFVGRIATLVYFGPTAGNAARDYAGTNDKKTASINLLLKLSQTLQSIRDNLDFYLKQKDQQSQDQSIIQLHSEASEPASSVVIEEVVERPSI